MKDQVEKRLRELQLEFDSGQKVAAELDAKQANVRHTLLRISGAIQVLEELLKNEKAVPPEAECAVNGAGRAAAGIR